MLRCKVMETKEGLLYIMNSKGDGFWMDSLAFHMSILGWKGVWLGFKPLTPDGWVFEIPEAGWDTLKANYKEEAK